MKKNTFLPGFGHPIQKFIFALLTFLILSGINFEFSNNSYFTQSYSNYLVGFFAISLMLLYILPFSLFINYLRKKWQIPRSLLIVALLAGLFIPGWIAANANQWLLDFWKLFIHSEHFWSDWGDALTAPIIEEGLKTVTALLVIYLFPKTTAKQTFIIALLIGIGFQIMEDISYITSEAFTHINTTIPQAINRIDMSMTSHWMYTSVLVMGLYTTIHHKTNHQTGWGIFWIVSPIVFHFLWDAPFNTNMFTNSIIGLAMTIVWLDLYLKVRQK